MIPIAVFFMPPVARWRKEQQECHNCHHCKSCDRYQREYIEKQPSRLMTQEEMRCYDQSVMAIVCWSISVLAIIISYLIYQIIKERKKNDPTAKPTNPSNHPKRPRTGHTYH